MRRVQQKCVKMHVLSEHWQRHWSKPLECCEQHATKPSPDTNSKASILQRLLNYPLRGCIVAGFIVTDRKA